MEEERGKERRGVRGREKGRGRERVLRKPNQFETKPVQHFVTSGA